MGDERHGSVMLLLTANRPKRDVGDITKQIDSHQKAKTYIAEQVMCIETHATASEIRHMVRCAYISKR